MISKRLNFIIFFSIILSSTLLISSISLDIKYQKELLNKQLNLLEISIKNEYKKRLKESINNTIILIKAYHKNKLEEQKKSNPTSQKLNEKNKKILTNLIKEHLHNSIFENNRYTSIDEVVNFKGGDNYAIRLIHPKQKESEGKFLSTNFEDEKGNKPFLEELNGIKKDGELCSTYYFKQQNTNQTIQKMSYAKLYKPFNWIITTSISINDLNNIIASNKIKFEEQHNNHLLLVILLKTFFFLSFIILLIILIKKLAKTINKNLFLNKELKNKVKKMELSFDKFFELPSNILLISDFKGKILQVNKGWEIILGEKKENVLNKNFLEYVHQNDIEATKKEMKQLSKGKTTFYFENRVKNKKGEYTTLAWSANSIPKSNLLYAIAHDITELKEKSNIMYQQAKMAAIGEMTANIAHQWRQPLSIISTASSGVLLKKMTDDLDDEFLINTMNQITQSTQYLSDTIEDFRNFYNPRKEKTEFTINYLFTKTLNLIKKKFDNEDIEIIKNIEDIKVQSFENELLQVIINILNNARDQLIKINSEKKLIFVNAYRKDEKVYIEIIDNANGIDENIIDRIFEPYFTTKDKAIGTGIGLYMSEEIINKHLKGKLLVKNLSYEYEKIKYTGAKFTIVFDAEE